MNFKIQNNILDIDQFQIVEKKETLSQYYDWSLINGNFISKNYNGKGETVAVLDTGCDISHKDLTSYYVFKNFIDDSQFLDENGHGTFCSGQIVAQNNSFGVVGIAPKAQLFAGKVLHGNYKDGRVKNFDEILAHAITYSAAMGCGVISMSIGMATPNQKIKDAIEYATNKGSILIAAAGNHGMSGSTYLSYPAAYEEVISVSSADSNLMPTWFSAEGSGNNRLTQPEVAIASQEYYWGCIPDNKYGKMIGTSMAAPIVSGVACLWRQALKENGIILRGDEYLNEFRTWLYSNSKDSNKNGWDKALGYGVLILNDKSL